MTFSFRPGKRENVKLLIGLAGGTGSGKTYSAMRLASGIAGDKPFCVIDTEAGRANHYADLFRFDHGDMKAPFTPDAYMEAIQAADKAGYPAVVVDSMSHVWAGDGGVLDWMEDELSRMAGTDYQKREACKFAAWVKPKGAHKKMVNGLLQLRTHLIICFRAEEKTEMVKVDGKWKVQHKEGPTGRDGWMPICEHRFPFELTASFLMMAEDGKGHKPGVPLPIKLEERHKVIFPEGKLIDEEAGKRLLAWANAAPAPNGPAPGAAVPPAAEQKMEQPRKMSEAARKGFVAVALRNGWSQAVIDGKLAQCVDEKAYHNQLDSVKYYRPDGTQVD